MPSLMHAIESKDLVPPVAAGRTPTHQDDFGAALWALRPTLTFRALRLTRDRSLAEDLVHQTFERALCAKTRFERGTNLRAWTLSIMRNLFIDGCRHDAVAIRPDAPTPWQPFDAPDGPLDVLGAEDLGPCLAALPAEAREILQLAYFDKVPRQEISARLGLPPSTTGTRLFRARAKLRRKLEALYARRVRDEGEAAGSAGQGCLRLPAR
jgi:RNA polymerase sigma-70 factor (ECF subfamily)